MIWKLDKVVKIYMVSCPLHLYSFSSPLPPPLLLLSSPLMPCSPVPLFPSSNLLSSSLTLLPSFSPSSLSSPHLSSPLLLIGSSPSLSSSLLPPHLSSPPSHPYQLLTRNRTMTKWSLNKWQEVIRCWEEKLTNCWKNWLTIYWNRWSNGWLSD